MNGSPECSSALPFKVNNLVLSGGGLSAIAILGALKRLSLTSVKFTNYAGSSFGAILALMMSIDMDLITAERLLLEFDYEHHQSCNLELLLSHYGLDDGIKIEQYICKLLRQHTGLNDPTFKQLHEKYHNTLWISAVEINRSRATHKDQIVYWNHLNAPDMPIALAIRSSISIPFVFTGSRIKDKIYVDGCIVDNFPVTLFSPDTTLGIRISNREHAVREHDTKPTVEASHPPSNLYQHVAGIWSCVYTEMQRLRQKLYQYPYILTISVESGLSLTVDQKSRKQLINDGFDAMDIMIRKLRSRAFLSTRSKQKCSDAHLSAYETPWMKNMLELVHKTVEFDRDDPSQVSRIKSLIYAIHETSTT